MIVTLVGEKGTDRITPVLYQAEEMVKWRVADAAKNSRIEPHAGMAEPVTM